MVAFTAAIDAPFVPVLNAVGAAKAQTLPAIITIKTIIIDLASSRTDGATRAPTIDIRLVAIL
jgi:hypothetical protein